MPVALRFDRRHQTPELRVLSLAMALALAVCGGCESQKKEPWETAPLKPGAVEIVHLPETSGLSVDRVRFYSSELNEPRFFLALQPTTGKQLEKVLVVNHGWADRPEGCTYHPVFGTDHDPYQDTRVSVLKRRLKQAPYR